VNVGRVANAKGSRLETLRDGVNRAIQKKRTDPETAETKKRTDPETP